MTMNKPTDQALAIDIGTSKITLVQFDLKSMEVIETATGPTTQNPASLHEHKHEQTAEDLGYRAGSVRQMQSLSSVSFIAITVRCMESSSSMRR